MYKSYFKMGWRNLLKNQRYAIINIGGLALGISCALIIFAIVKHHLTFDDFHSDSDRIYRIVTEQHRDEISYRYSVPGPLGKVFRDEYTHAEKVARICTFDEQIITIESGSDVRKFKETEVAFAETGFFEIFNYPLLIGNTKKALTEPNTVILTERIAKKYFGDEDPINKTLRLDNRIDLKVSGILNDLPVNSDRQTEIYISYNTLKQFNVWSADEDAWGGISSSMQCFVKLLPNVSTHEVEAVLAPYVKKYRPTSKNVHHYKLQPLNDIHFNEKYGGAMNKSNLLVFSLVGFFLLLTACVNFVNLATAQASHRSKEVGIRKVLGSVRSQLFWQFIIETGLITLMATILALCLSHLLLPSLSEWFNSVIRFDLFSDVPLTLFIVALVFGVTLFSGFYPAILLAGFKPVASLKGKISHAREGGFQVRRTLIVGQFFISQVLIIGLLVIARQMHYATQSDMGFTRDAIVMVPIGSYDEKRETLKHQLMQISGVEKLSLCFDAPASSSFWTTSLRFENRTEEESFSISYKGADENYLSLFELNLIAGRNVLPSDSAKEFVVNESFVKKLNISNEDILGSTMVAGSEMGGNIVGVVEDFHDRSFHEVINPIFISAKKDQYNYYALKINMQDATNTLTAIGQAWNSMYPEQIYEYQFLDEQIAALYTSEETMMKLIQTFSLVALFIGCMGLYGLVSFMAIQKTKEIGIRKVLGGNVWQILWIFGKELSWLIIVAFALAAPISWWLMDKWLQNFEYKLPLTLWIFALSMMLTFGIALLTVGYESIKAALVNPVKSLRSE